MDADSKTFIVYVAIQEQEEMVVDPGKKAQIEAQSKAQVRVLLFNKASTKVPAEYFDYSNVFSAKNIAELSKNTGMNEYAFELKEGKQPPFRPIYSLGLVELETLKTYIETNLSNGFIRPSKSPAGVPILFNWKPNESLHFYINYWGLNNITIKNQYLLLLIGKLLDWLGQARRFTQLDLTNVYH